MEILVEKVKKAIEMYPEVQSIVVAGGVSANENLRERFRTVFSSTILSPFFPSPKLSGDNGAMVAAAAFFEIQSGVEPVDPYALNIYPRISIES